MKNQHHKPTKYKDPPNKILLYSRAQIYCLDLFVQWHFRGSQNPGTSLDILYCAKNTKKINNFIIFVSGFYLKDDFLVFVSSAVTGRSAGFFFTIYIRSYKRMKNKKKLFLILGATFLYMMSFLGLNLNFIFRGSTARFCCYCCCYWRGNLIHYWMFRLFVLNATDIRYQLMWPNSKHWYHSLCS